MTRLTSPPAPPHIERGYQTFFTKGVVVLFSILLLYSSGLLAQTFPPQPQPPRLVNDLAGVLSQGEQQSLEAKLLRYNDSTSTQIAIVTMHSVGDNDISEYAPKLGDAWGIGQKGKNNGILILAAMDDHKVFIATGQGVQGRIPDMLARRVIDGYITPNFKKGKYYDGLNQATDALFKLLTGEFKADDIPNGKKGISYPVTPGELILLIFIILIIVTNIWGWFSGDRAKGYTSSGSYRGGGFLGGGFFGSGGFGGGGSDGGGFGGFGGGSFDGGGAGGSW